MSKVLIIIVTINLLIVGTIAGTLFLAETYPFSPGEGFYPLQNSAEQLRLRLTTDNERQAYWTFELAERRLADLAHCETDYVVYSLMAFDSSLQAAGEHILSLVEEHELHASLNQLLQQADIIIAGVENQSSDKVAQALVINLKDLVASLQVQPSQQNVTRVSQVPDNTLTEAVPIPFLGEEDFDHAFFPLEGKHAETQCDLCHVNGLYASTPTDCQGCHDLPHTVIYPNHFRGECDECHDLNNWESVIFDHVGIMECKSCHVDDTPTGHSAYIFRDEILAASLQPISTSELIKKLDDGTHDGERPCTDCHVDYEDWTQVIFTHEDGFLDCIMCHTSETPEQHYDGQCSRCHNTTVWDEYTFDHTGYTDCRSCHQSIHENYPLLCTDCHRDTDNWWKLYFVHEEASDCTSCHTEDAPAGHYDGQCSNCHGTEIWDEISFSHTGMVDCQSCHNGPVNHYDGQCSNCHGTSVWMPAWFNHSGFGNCNSCHSKASHYNSYQCSVCHTVGNWLFDHSRIEDCALCHTAPTGHYAGQCSNCHSRNNWNDYIFNHIGLNDCAGCHTAPSAHVFNGQCSMCHNTSSWSQVAWDHSNVSDCTSCHAGPPDHYTGPCCCNCHSPSSWTDIHFSHEGATDCVSCHPAPFGHWPGQCSDCHSTGNWADYTFNHAGYDNCKACHGVQRPSGHQNGQCSKCHTTDTWYVPPTPIPPTNTPTPTPTNTPIPTPTDTPVPTPTDTPVPTPTDTPVPTPTDTPVPPPTDTPVPTPTDTPTP